MPSQQISSNMQSANTLATPAIVGQVANNANNQYSPQQQQQNHMYQAQQLSAASKQHFIQQQQRLNNGLYSPAATDDGNSSGERSLVGHQPHPFEAHQQSGAHHIYNGYQAGGNSIAQQRPAPIYAPKPIYYSSPQARPQQQQQMNGQQLYYTNQQQNSPQQQQIINSSNEHMNGRQVAGNTNNINTLPQNGSMLAISPPPQQHPPVMQSPSTIDRRSSQMQQLAMSYQVQQQLQQQAMQQQQQQQPYVHQPTQPHQAAAAMAHGATMLDGSFIWQPMSNGRMPNQQPQQVPPNHLVPQHHLVIEQQQQQLSPPPSAHARQQPQQQQFRYSNQQQLEQPRPPMAALNRSHFSDRDSISTISRMNQFDERRSITMRSQFTTHHTGGRRQFGFIELTNEALRRLLGFRTSADGNLGSNISSSVSGARVPLLNERQKMMQQHATTNPDASVKLGTSQSLAAGGVNTSQSNSSHNKLTVIDSAEDYHFKRQVFKYQLRILLITRFIFSAVVLLSPVAMLLVPKMEPLLNSLSSGGESNEYSSTSQTNPLPAVRTGVITHGVGLMHRNPIAINGQQMQQNQSMQWRIGECNSSDCDGPLIGFVVRLFMLAVAHWAIFFRTQTSTLPRIDFHRCLLASMTVLITSAYWLFFTFRLFDKRFNDFELQYLTIVNFAVSMLESLILLHYLGVVLLELRSRKKIYCLKVVRSPDGESHYFSCGAISIQKCARFVLEKYHREFRHFDSHSEQILALESEIAHGGSAKSSSSANHDRQPNSRSSRRRQRTDQRPTSSARSTSRSPARSTRSDRRGESGSRSRADAQTKVYQLDLGPPKRADNDNDTQPSEVNKSVSGESKANERESKDQITEARVNSARSEDIEADNSGADGGHSSDATSRMKESSLETIRAAGSIGGVNNNQPSSGANADHRDLDIEVNDSRKSQHSHKQHRDEIESVRSARSRKSTSRHRDRDSRHRISSHHRASSGHHSSRMSHHGHHGHGSSNNRDEANLTDADLERQISVDNSSNAIEEHERKLRRRQLRLLATVEDAFEQVHRKNDAGQKIISPAVDSGSAVVDTGALGSNGSNNQQPRHTTLDASQTARALYPSIARSLQKYLRLTRQAGRHNLQSIYEHLSKCLLYGLSARTFIEKFVQRDPVWQSSETELFANCRLEMDASRPPRDDFEVNTWSLICDTFVSREINSGTFFLLRQGQVSLLVTVAKLPHTNINEEMLDKRMCKFALGPRDSETSSV